MTITKYQTNSGVRYKSVFKHNLQVYKKHGFTSFKDAKAWEAEERTRANAGGTRINANMTVSEYLDWWHASFVWRSKEKIYHRSHKKRRMGRANYIRNAQHIARLNNSIGHVKLSKLDPNIVYRMEEDVSKPSEKLKALSASSIRKMQFMLKGALEDGVAEKKLHKNPLYGMEAITVEKRKGEVIVFQDDESEKILTVANQLYAEDRRWYLWVRLALWTGLRKGELAGLQWGDIEGHKLEVRRAVDWSLGDTKPELKLPKSDAGLRSVPLVPGVVTDLKAYRSWQAEFFLKAGQKINAETHIFFDERTFGIIHKSVPQHRWNKLLKLVAMEHRSMHKNRHTFISRCIRAGMRPELVTAVAGHSEQRITQETYGHLFEEAFEEQLKLMEGIEAELAKV